jgi:hypothetical protein
MDMVQHIVVTLAALGAAIAVYRRLFGHAETGVTRTGCEGCASGVDACGSVAPRAGGAIHHPVTLIRTSPHVPNRISLAGTSDRP